MRNHLEIINVTDIAVAFKDKVFELKTSPCCDLTRQALKKTNYLTNMWVYSNICKFEGMLIEYKTQTTDEVNNFTIHYLN